MAKKSDFTEEEWDQLRKGATGAGLLVSTSDRSFFDSFKEAGSLAKQLLKPFGIEVLGYVVELGGLAIEPPTATLAQKRAARAASPPLPCPISSRQGSNSRLKIVLTLIPPTITAARPR